MNRNNNKTNNDPSSKQSFHEYSLCHHVKKNKNSSIKSPECRAPSAIKHRYDVPILSLSLASIYLEKVLKEKGTVGNPRAAAENKATSRRLQMSNKISRYSATPAAFDDNRFVVAYHVEGDTMTATSGLSFPAGSIVFFDYSIKPRAGDFVAAFCTSTRRATFKQLVCDLGHFYLKPLNPAYPTIPVDNSIIVCAVARRLEINL